MKKFKVARMGVIILVLLSLTGTTVPVFAAAPAAPGNLTAAIGSDMDGQVVVNLTWRDNSTNETGFVIESATNAAFNLDYIEFHLSANTTSFVDTTVVGYPSTRFYYRVYALSSDGRSSYSNTVNVLEPPIVIPTAPAAPNSLASTSVTSTSVNLSWHDNSANEKGFIVERATNTGFTANVVTFSTDTPNVTTLLDDTVSPSSTYYYRVYAWNVVDVSAYSNVLKVTTPAPSAPPATPGNLTAGPLGGNSIFLSWTDNSNNESGFKIERATNSTFTQNLSTFTVAANIVSYLDAAVVPGTTYFYRVKATNSEGDSPTSNVVSVSFTQPTTAPSLAAPANLTATVIGTSQVRLQWNDNSTGESGFIIERAERMNFSQDVETFTVSSNTRSYLDAAIETGSVYFYRVKAYNALGNSAPSNIVRAVIPSPATTTPPEETTTAPPTGTSTQPAETTTLPPPAPSAPSALRITLVTSSTVNVTWVDNSRNENGFLLQRASSSLFNTDLKEFNLPASSEIYQDGSVEAGASYYYRVIAKGTAANSAPSNVLFVNIPLPVTTTPPANTGTSTLPTAPAPPTLQTNTTVTQTTVPASWPTFTNPAENRAEYQIPASEAPTVLIAKAGSRSVSLTWKDNSNHESGFYVERSSDGENWTRVGSTGINQISFSDRGRDGKTDWWSRLIAFLFGGLQRQTSYSYRVRAYGGSVVSACSETVAVVTR